MKVKKLTWKPILRNSPLQMNVRVTEQYILFLLPTAAALTLVLLILAACDGAVL